MSKPETNTIARRWYSIGLDGEFEEHDSPEEAEQSAMDQLELARDQGEWAEDTDCIEWGELVCHGYAVEFSRVAAVDDETGECASRGFARLADYELQNAVPEKVLVSREAH